MCFKPADTSLCRRPARRFAAFALLGLLTVAGGCGGADGSAGEARSASASGTTQEDTALRLTPVLTTPDPGQGSGFNSLEVRGTPSHGSANPIGTQLNYQPDPNYFGVDQFTFAAITNSGTILGTATVTITPVNDPPAATDAAVNTNEDMALTFTPAVSDPDPGDVLTLSVPVQPVNGTVTISGGQFIYTPNPHGNLGWTDTFGYTVSDDATPTPTTATATVTVTVADVNHPPGSAQLSASPVSGVRTLLTPTVTDPDGDVLFTYSIASQPANGLAEIDTTTGRIAYTSNLAFISGSDDFTFNVTDSGGALLAAPATASINVAAVGNNRPVSNTPLAITTNEDTATSPPPPDVTDPEGDSLTFRIVSQPAGVGTLTGGANISYTPAANYNGTFDFFYQAADAAGLEMAASVMGTVTVTPVNDPPVVTGTVVRTINENSAGITIDLTSPPVFTDPDLGDTPPDTHSAALNGTVPNGTVTPIAGSAALFFTPDVNFDGVISFGFTVSDAAGASATGSVTITVNNTNNPPSVSPLTASVLQGVQTAIGLTVTDPDASNNPTLLPISVAPLHGSADTLGTSVRYTPDPGFLGVDQLTVVASDGFATSAPAIITIVVGKRTGSQPQDVVFGDFNGDGNADLAVANELGDATDEVVSIFLGDGIGGLGTRVPVAPTNPGAVLLGAIALAAGDLNGDTLDDLVIVYQDNDSYAVALGNATALNIVAGAANPLGSLVFPRAPVLDNFDGAPLDLAVVNSLTDEVVVLQGNGDGSFGLELARLTLGNSTSPWDLASGDLNGDGVPDLSLVSLQRNAGALDIVDSFINGSVLGVGTATFTQALNEVGTASLDADADLTMADLNGDGRADVVRTLVASNQVAVFLANADGSLSSHTLYTVGLAPSDVTVADTDGDGLLDIATANRGDGTITILPGLGATAPGDGTFDALSTLITHAAPGAIAAGQLDAGAGADIATVHPATNLLGVRFR